MSNTTHRFRWLWAIALLVVLLAVLLFQARSNPEATTNQPADASQVAETDSAEPSPEADGSVEEALPVLDSLPSWDQDKPPARRNLDLQHWTTEQGTRVYFMPAAELPMVDVQLLFSAGASRDDGQPGLATLTNGMLGEGTENRDAGEIAAGFERLGAQFSNSSHRDMASASLRSLAAPDKLDPAINLFAEVVTRPSFPADAFERLRNQLLASLQFRLQQPSALASETFWNGLYGDHPYGHLPQGTPESLSALTPQELEAFHQRFYSAGNAVVSIVGAIDRRQAERIAQRLADALPQGPAADPLPPPEQAPVETGRKHVEFHGQQVHILMGQLGINRGDPDYAALYVANEILGGSGFGSRLMEEIRERRGLSYSVSSGFSPMQVAGPFIIRMQTRADQAELALSVLNDSLRSFIENGPTEAELKRTKRQLMGAFPLSTASNAAIVGQLGMIGFYDLPLNHLQLFMDQVQALTVEQVRDAFARHISLDQQLIVTVGPPPEPEAETTEGEDAAQQPGETSEPEATETEQP
ncbi:zinc protease [Halopseudomonas xinjiangensis]|uniref:Zinc protease n=1 Tax=Halopseudomonas xinjiangensis TaxID=487184 RepID=A0A1H1XB08_9GAMM|nr:pitrilysin family protein [Halopseudomonas xinjiangensis]SDT05886.1 zinc protease [Halopseudomonas xinjiangensis]